MPGRELLERFRPAAAPGPVGRVGVPAEVHEDAELVAVLGSLAPTVSQAEALRDRAREQVRTLAQDTDRQVRAIVARARLDAAEARAAAAARAREAGRREGERLMAEATDRARALRADGERDLPGVVTDVVEALTAEIAAEGLTASPGERR
jgi:uncharacterized protein YgbK (DUF1537 family)